MWIGVEKEKTLVLRSPPILAFARKHGATAFCNYYGYRLPTEWEWQAVADYDGSFTHGCGTSINNSIANYYYSTHPNGTTIVGAFGAYGYGMCDMAGNVLEWTSTV
jgi:formylglycine-generating enzyme required for sulfatase activity